ncbi:MAG: T9SS type A sorting domain-containing protein [Bacteroidales bacterium]|nr:T9SS type A sorting domain-containing protein [Bacteroidales bacterium]
MNKLSFLFVLIILPLLGFTQNGKNISKSENTYSGYVFMGENLLPKGKVYLIDNSKNIYSTEDVTEVNEGAFLFSNLKSGKYMLYVIPEHDYDFFYFPKYIPTYSGNSFKWESSKSILYLNGATKNNINLISFAEPFYGNSMISGKIKYDLGYRGGRYIPIPIILLNEKRKPIDFRIADSFEGVFIFEHLPEGKYYLHPEIPGIKTEELEIIVKSDEENKRARFLVDNNSIKPERAAGSLNPIITENNLKVFLNQEFELPVICELTDMSGKSIVKNIYSTEDIYINTSGFNAGIYLLRVRTFNNSILKTAKVYINNY